MPDLMATGDDPGTQYIPSETMPSGVYHEDREVTVPSGPGSQMFRVIGAQFDPISGNWSLQSSATIAYATVQNPDGSIHYFTQSEPLGWSTAQWLGSGNNNVYNAVDYGLSAAGSGGDNTTALQAAVTAAINATGGTIFIPQGSYELSGAVSIDTSANAGIIIAGVSGLTELLQTAAYPIFDVTASGKDCGIRFRDLRLRYSSLPTSSGLFAVNVTGSDNVTCERVTFKDCPGSFQTASNCEFCGLFDCYIDYGATTADDGSPLDSQTMVSLSGVENFVAQCVIFQSNNATDCIGISLLGNNNGRFISNTHISDLYTGISIASGGTEGLNGIYVSEVLINTSQNAVVIEPSVASYTTHDIHFTDCTFAAMNGANMQTSGVQISIPSGGIANRRGLYLFHRLLSVRVGQRGHRDRCGTEHCYCRRPVFLKWSKFAGDLPGSGHCGVGRIAGNDYWSRLLRGQPALESYCSRATGTAIRDIVIPRRRKR